MAEKPISAVPQKDSPTTIAFPNKKIYPSTAILAFGIASLFVSLFTAFQSQQLQGQVASPKPGVIPSASISGIVPVIISPVSGASERTLISWNAVAGATHYVVYVEDYSYGGHSSILNVTRPTSVLKVDGSDVLSLNITDEKTAYLFNAGGIYQVWVRAVRDEGNLASTLSSNAEFSKWSSGRAFIPGVGTRGSDPTGTMSTQKPIVSIKTDVPNRAAYISWQRMEGAGAYELYIFNNALQRIEKIATFDRNTLNYAENYPTSAGSTFTVWVRAVGGDVFSAWSDTQVFLLKK